MKKLICSLLFLIGLTAAASACPDIRAYGETYKMTGKQLYSRKEFSVVAGGDSWISKCGNVRPTSESGDWGEGRVATRPDFSIELSGMSRYQLSIGALTDVAGCDPVLLINTGSENFYYDDDDWGDGDALIELTRPSNGWLDIWVGTYAGDVCDATLVLETFDRK